MFVLCECVCWGLLNMSVWEKERKRQREGRERERERENIEEGGGKMEERESPPLVSGWGRCWLQTILSTPLIPPGRPPCPPRPLEPAGSAGEWVEPYWCTSVAGTMRLVSVVTDRHNPTPAKGKLTIIPVYFLCGSHTCRYAWASTGIVFSRLVDNNVITFIMTSLPRSPPLSLSLSLSLTLSLSLSHTHTHTHTYAYAHMYRV